MNTYSFRKDLISVQEELLCFAYKLTADKEEDVYKRQAVRWQVVFQYSSRVFWL